MGAERWVGDGLPSPTLSFALPISAWGIAERAMHQLPGCRSAAEAVREPPLRAGLKRCGGAGTLPYPCHSE
jgi:hypothetical protein